MTKINALIRFYFHIDPATLTDEQWAKSWGELEFAIRFHQKNMTGMITDPKGSKAT